MRWARLLPAIFVLFTVLVDRPLAEASPPDPTWIAGLYDNGDGDDVIVAVTSASAVLDAHPVHRMAPTLFVIDSLDDVGSDLVALDAFFAYRPRSPPSD